MHPQFPRHPSLPHILLPYLFYLHCSLAKALEESVFIPTLQMADVYHRVRAHHALARK
jgi:hypothetical protein